MDKIETTIDILARARQLFKLIAQEKKIAQVTGMQYLTEFEQINIKIIAKELMAALQHELNYEAELDKKGE